MYVGFFELNYCEGTGSHSFYAEADHSDERPRRKAKIGIARELEETQAPADAEAPAAPSSLIAKKDFEIFHNGYHRTIRAGEDISDVPELYHPNLRTEGVL